MRSPERPFPPEPLHRNPEARLKVRGRRRAMPRRYPRTPSRHHPVQGRAMLPDKHSPRFLVGCCGFFFRFGFVGFFLLFILFRFSSVFVFKLLRNEDVRGLRRCEACRPPSSCLVAVRPYRESRSTHTAGIFRGWGGGTGVVGGAAGPGQRSSPHPCARLPLLDGPDPR